MDANVVKEYLVKLGFDVDNQGFNKFNNSLQAASKAFQAQSSGMATSYLQTATVIATSLSTITAATVGLIDKTAQLDLTYQKLGLHMYMAKDQAKQYKIITDAMGESIDDIAWIPELRKRYLDLMNQAKGMELPSDSAGVLQHIRDISFEFTRLKVEVTYGMQWIGYYLSKYLSGPINDIQVVMKNLNDFIQSHIQEWSKVIAGGLNTLMTWIGYLVPIIQTVYKVFADLWDSLSGGEKLVAGLGIAFRALFIPVVGEAIAIVEAFLALKTYLDDIGKGNVLSELGQSVGKLAMAFMELFKTILNNKVVKAFLDMMIDGLVKNIQLLTLLVNLFANLFDAVGAALGGNLIKAWGILGKAAKQFAQEVQDIYSGKKGNTTQGTGTTDDVNTGSGKPVSHIAGLDQFMESLSTNGEGHGTKQDYGSGAHDDAGRWNMGGKYQILKDNWSSWCQEAGLPADAPYSAANQETVARYEIAKAYQQYHDWGAVAAWWNGGPDAAESYIKNGTYSGQDTDHGGYVARVLGNNSGGSSTNTVGSSVANTIPASSSVVNSGSNITIGSMNIQVPAGTKDPESYARSVMQQMNEQMGINNARQTRYFGGITG